MSWPPATGPAQSAGFVPFRYDRVVGCRSCFAAASDKRAMCLAPAGRDFSAADRRCPLVAPPGVQGVGAERVDVLRPTRQEYR
jgi:hypothetical protein